MLGGDAVGRGEVEVPISFPTGYVEAWRYSSTEELELTGFDGGLQGHGLVQLSSKHRAHCDMALHSRSGDRTGGARFSLLQAVVSQSRFHHKKQSLKSFTEFQVSTQLPI